MEMSKLRLATVLLLLITVTCAIATYLSIQNYQAWCEEKLLEYPEGIRPYVDFNPFWATRQGKFILLINLAIVSLGWFCFIKLKMEIQS